MRIIINTTAAGDPTPPIEGRGVPKTLSGPTRPKFFT